LPLGSAILLVAIIGGLLFFAMWLSRYKMNKAVKQIIEIFREKGALDPGSAMSRRELGLLSLKEQSFAERALKPRDYKVYAFDVMFNLNIIRSTDDEKYYLSEQALQSSKLEDKFTPR